MDMAVDLDTRLPCALARLGTGDIDGDRAYAIWYYTRSLSAEDAARADEILAKVAPDLRYDQLARKASALEMKLDPEAARLRKEKALKEEGRVEVRRETSGNASLSGRELGIADVLSAKANVDALAAQLRRSGVAGTLRELRVQVYMDLLQGRDPLARLSFTTAPGRPGGRPPADEDDGDRCHADGGTDSPGDQASDPDTSDPDAGNQGYAADSRRPVAPLPALINLIIPVKTCL